MYAVIQCGGKQYRVGVGDVIRVERLEVPAGDSVDLHEVLMVSDGQEVKVGNPMLAGSSVTARVRGHGRGEKIRVVKFRRRKHYRKTAGHRQNYTELEITAIK
jgi:large subunit ribosomal protein L21